MTSGVYVRRKGLKRKSTNKKRPILERFNEKYVVNEETGCWEWIACKNNKGYAMISVNNTSLLASRVSYELFIGPIPDGMCVLHKCDNPLCVNPEHLFLGTQIDNLQDMTNKGRRKPYGLPGDNILPDEQIIEIRSRPIYKGSQTALAKEFNVTPSHISSIINNKHRKNT